MCSPYFISSRASNAGVVSHGQVVEDQAGVFVELADFLGDVFGAFRLDQTDSEARQAGEVLGAVSGANAATVLVEVPIEDVVAAVFDGPVSAVDIEQAFGINLSRRAAGNAISEIAGRFTGFLVDHDPFDEKDLSDMGEVEIAVEFGRGPDATVFEPTVVRRIESFEVRMFSILEQQHRSSRIEA